MLNEHHELPALSAYIGVPGTLIYRFVGTHSPPHHHLPDTREVISWPIVTFFNGANTISHSVRFPHSTMEPLSHCIVGNDYIDLNILSAELSANKAIPVHNPMAKPEP